MAKTSIMVRILGDAKNLTGSLKVADGSLARFASGAAAAGAAVAAATIAGTVALAGLGRAFDKEYDKIRVGTGATGTALAGLQGSFKNVLKNVPTDFGSAGTAIADLNTRLGLTGKPLEDLAAQFLNLSRITGTDIKTNVDQATRVFGDWGIATKDQASALDKLYRASQASGIGLGDLQSSVVQFGAPLRNLGFNFESATALMALWNKTGVNTETAMAGLKAGVGKLAKAGEDVPTTFSRIVKEMQKMGPGTKATALAIKLFGQRAGPDLADAIAGGKFSLEEMLAAINGGKDTINGAARDTEDFGEKWLRLRNRVLVFVEPAATRLFTLMGEGMDFITRAAARMQPAVAASFGWIAANRSRITAPIYAVRDAVQSAAGWIVDHKDQIIGATRGAFGWIMDHRAELIAAFVGVSVVIAGSLVPAAITWAAAMTSAAVATIAATWPILAIAAGVAALAAGFVYAYKRVDWFRRGVDATGRWLKNDFWPGVQTVFRGVAQVVSWGVGMARRYVEDFVSAARYLWDRFGSDITRMTVGAFRGISMVVGGWLNVMRGSLRVFTSIFTGDWRGAWRGVEQMTRGYTRAIQGLTSAFMAYVRAAFSIGWRAASLVVSAAWREIRATIGNYTSAAYRVVTGFLDSVRTRFINYWGAASSVLRGSWVAMRQTVGDYTAAIYNVITGWLDSTRNRFIGYWASLSNIVRGAWASMRKTVGDYTAAIFSVVGGWLDSLWRRFINYWTITFPAAVRYSFDAMRNTVVGGAAAIYGLMVSSLGNLRTAFNNYWSGIRGAVVAAWSGIRSAASSGAAAVGAAFRSIPGSIGNAAGAMWATGARLGSSLVGGLRSAVGGVSSAITSGMRSALNTVAGWWNRLGFTLPSISMTIPTNKLTEALKIAGSSFSAGGGYFGTPDIPYFHSGGIVGNPFGPPRDIPAVLQQGEEVLARNDPRNSRNGGGAPLVGVVNVIDGRDLNRELARYQTLQAAMA